MEQTKTDLSCEYSLIVSALTGAFWQNRSKVPASRTGDVACGRSKQMNVCSSWLKIALQTNYIQIWINSGCCGPDDVICSFPAPRWKSPSSSSFYLLHTEAKRNPVPSEIWKVEKCAITNPYWSPVKVYLLEMKCFPCSLPLHCIIQVTFTAMLAQVWLLWTLLLWRESVLYL